jgi:hypothetical protein
LQEKRLPVEILAIKWFPLVSPEKKMLKSRLPLKISIIEPEF